MSIWQFIIICLLILYGITSINYNLKEIRYTQDMLLGKLCKIELSVTEKDR